MSDDNPTYEDGYADGLTDGENRMRLYWERRHREEMWALAARLTEGAGGRIEVPAVVIVGDTPSLRTFDQVSNDSVVYETRRLADRASAAAGGTQNG